MGNLARLLIAAPILAGQTVTISTPPPPGPSSVQAAYTGPAGPNLQPVYYWVVARYATGLSPSVTYSTAQVPGGVTKVSPTQTVRISWSSPSSNVTGFDIIKSATPIYPASCPACAALLNVTTSPQTDTGGTQAYPPGGTGQAPAAAGVISMNNQNSGAPYPQIAINGGPAVEIQTGKDTLDFQQNGTPLGSANTINCGTNLTCSVSANIAKLDTDGGTINVRACGATGNGVTNDGPKIQTCLDTAAAKNGTVFFPDGTYRINAPLTVQCSIEMQAGASIVAGAAMAQVLTVGTASYLNNASWLGGTVNANNLANDAILLDRFQHFAMSQVTTENALNNGFHVGTGSGVYTSYEYIGDALHYLRTAGMLSAGSAGMLIDSNATDSNVAHSIFVGAETGLKVSSGGNVFTDIHVWSPASAGWMITAFDDNANANIWKGCQADTPQTYGLRARQFNTVIIGNKFFNNAIIGTDNLMTAIQFDQATPAATVTANVFQGADSSHRIATDIGGFSNYNSMTFSGNQEANVVTQRAFNARFGNPLFVQSGAATTGRFGADSMLMRSTGVYGISADTTLLGTSVAQVGWSDCGASCFAIGNGTQGNTSAIAHAGGFQNNNASCTGLATILVDDGTCRQLTTFIAGNASGNTIGAGATSYLPFGVSSPSTTQVQRSFIVPAAATLAHLYMVTTSTQNIAGSMVCAITQNGTTPTALTVTFAAGDGPETKSDLLHTLTVAQGDVLSFQCVNNDVIGTSATIGSWSVGLY